MPGQTSADVAAETAWAEKQEGQDLGDVVPGGSGRPASATPLPVDGSWVLLDEYGVSAGDFFTGSWEFSGPAAFNITDYFVTTDKYEVYDSSVLVATIDNGTEWSSLGGACVDPVSVACHWTNDPDVAFADPVFAKGTILFGAGPHSITIKSIYVPLTDTGAPFPDSTVAFNATAVPEPASLLLLGTGLAGVAVLGRRRRRT